MRKRIILVMMLAVMIVSSVFASEGEKRSGFAIGHNLGTNSGIEARFTFKSFSIYANTGLDFLGLRRADFAIGVDLGAEMTVLDLDLGENGHIPLKIGIMQPTCYLFDGDNGFTFAVGLFATAGLEYQIPDSGFIFYTRFGFGPKVYIPTNRTYCSLTGAVGVLYEF